VNPCRLGGL